MTQAQLNPLDKPLWDIAGQFHDTLKTHKKGLMKQLFPAIEEAIG